MLTTIDLETIKDELKTCAAEDIRLLNNLRQEVKPLYNKSKIVRPRNTTAISLVASDGGNNQLIYDPFHFQIVRVVDSNGKVLCLEIISPTTDTDLLSNKHFNGGVPESPLGKMMKDLNCEKLSELSPMIPSGYKIRNKPDEVSPVWVQVYRDLWEWAILYDKIKYFNFSTPTLILRDGLLRSKIFSGEKFVELRKLIEEAIRIQYSENKIKLFLIGLAKHSKVLERYRLAMAIENIMPAGGPRYLHVPRKLEEKSYIWNEYARGAETEGGEGEMPKFVAGDMYFVRFGKHTGDPIWIVDIFSSQKAKDDEIFGFLLQDAINGFPVPYYPLALQRAHEYAQITDFDTEVFQDEIIKAIREELPEEGKSEFDAQSLNNIDKANYRYK